MIKEVSGDILLTQAQVLAHGVSPNDNFSAGLAHGLREEWPALYKDFRHYCQTYHPKSGGLWTWAAPEGKRFVNLFTQEPAYESDGKPGRATLTHVGHALRDFRKLIDEEGFESVALPKLATGIGGLEWKDVQPLIVKHLGDLKIPVYVYTVFQKGVKAAEG